MFSLKVPRKIYFLINKKTKIVFSKLRIIRAEWEHLKYNVLVIKFIEENFAENVKRAVSQFPDYEKHVNA